MLVRDGLQRCARVDADGLSAHRLSVLLNSQLRAASPSKQGALLGVVLTFHAIQANTYSPQ